MPELQHRTVQTVCRKAQAKRKTEIASDQGLQRHDVGAAIQCKPEPSEGEKLSRYPEVEQASQEPEKVAVVSPRRHKPVSEVQGLNPVSAAA